MEDQVLIVFEIEYNTAVGDMLWNNITIEDKLLLDVELITLLQKIGFYQN